MPGNHGVATTPYHQLPVDPSSQVEPSYATLDGASTCWIYCPSKLNSARRRDNSQCGGRGVECVDVRLDLLCHRCSRSRRRCSLEASSKSVSHTRSILVTTTDNPLRIDSVKGCKGRSGIIESVEVVRRDKEQAMSHARAVRISAHHPVLIVISKQDRPNGARGIDREMQRSIGIPVEAVKDS